MRDGRSRPSGSSKTIPISPTLNTPGYDLRYRKTGEAWWTNAAERIQLRSETVSGLDDSATYEFRARARNQPSDPNDPDYSPTSPHYWLGPWSDVTMLGPPSAPNLSIGVPNQDGAVIFTKIWASWTRPASGGTTITGYELQHKGGSVSSWTDWPNITTAPGAQRGYTAITGLSSGTTYEVRVRAKSSAGDGPWPDVKSATTATPVTTPTPPVAGKPTVEVDSEIHTHHGKILMSWDKPSNNDTRSHFEAQYKGGSATNWTVANDPIKTDGSSWWTTVTGLDNGTEYDLRVHAVNTAEVAGAWSDVKSGKTRDALVKLIVRDSEEEEESSGLQSDLVFNTTHDRRGQIEVDWTNRNTSQACVTFEVQYKKPGEPDTSWASHPVDIYDRFGGIAVPGSVWITGLDDGTEYEVQARVENYSDTWYGPWSDTVTVTTLGAPPAPDLTVKGRAGQIIADFPVPARFRPLTGHDVQFRKAGQSSWTDYNHRGTDSIAWISGLQAGTTYQAQVRAVNQYSAGAWSNIESATTRNVPDIPAIEAVTSGDGKVTVWWQTPESYGASIIDYDVQYKALPSGGLVTHSADANDNTGNSATLDTANSREITGLTNGTTYAVQVRAQNSRGESIWSLVVTCRPESAAVDQAQAVGQAQAAGQFAGAQADPTPPADPPADQPAAPPADPPLVDPPTLIGLFNDAAIANGSTVALDMADYFSGDDLLYTVEVTTTNQRTGQTKTGLLNEIARNKVRGAWNDAVSVLMLSGGHAASQDLTITITATGTDGTSVSDSFTLSLVDEVPAPDLTPPGDPNPPADDPPPADPPPADPPPADPPPADPPPADPPPDDPDHNPATLIEEFDDLTLSDDQTHELDMADHFSGDGLTFVVEVTTTNQRTGQTKTGLLNEIARNKLSGSWNGSVLNLEGGHAASQTLTVKITATDSEGGTASDEFTFTLNN